MSIFSPLRFRDYRLYFYGQIVSMAGTSLQSMAQGWLVYDVTKSAGSLGLVMFFQQGTAFLMSPVVGLLADRYDRRKLFVMVEFTAMLQAIMLAGAVFLQMASVVVIAVLAAVLGVITSFELTLRHALVQDYVGKETLRNGIALNSITLNLARIVGPAIGGFASILLPKSWLGWCFLGNAGSYLFVALCVGLTCRGVSGAPDTPSEMRPAKFWSDLMVGIRYVYKESDLTMLIGISSFMSFVCFPYQILLPAFVGENFGGRPTTLTLLLSATGAGAILGCIQAARPANEDAAIRRIVFQIGILGVALFCMGTFGGLAVSLVIACIVGFCLNGAYPAINSAIQLRTDERLRSRVLSVYTMSFLGAIPVGSFILGRLAERFSTRIVLSWSGFLAVAFSVGLFIIRAGYFGKVIRYDDV